MYEKNLIRRLVLFVAMPSQTYEDFPTGVEVTVLPCSLYTYWMPSDGRIMPAPIGCNFAEQGIDREFVGRFCWGVIDELISSFGIVSLKQVRECTNSFGHIALSRGSLGATIYGISRGGNSRIYKAELDRTQLFPKLRW